ncbi:GPI transamidase component [Zalaria obscura]|uniref:GPI transamidase component n=1 Tax=Zalaria obscura TaxID=2024903 RepID=A0ACC3S478_9PEZI
MPIMLDVGSGPAVSDQMISTFQQKIDELNTFPLHRFRVSSASQDIDTEPVILVKLIADANQGSPRSNLLPYARVLEVYHAALKNSLEQSSLDSLADYVAHQVLDLFAEERATLSRLIPKAADSAISPELVERIDRRSMRSFKYAPTYHLTFSLFSGASTPSAWDIKAALDEYLTPLLQSFSSISTFTVDTQVQLYASLPPSMRGPVYDSESAQWTLEKADLSGFVNAAEWPLSPSIGLGPTINFILYAPSEGKSPLVIKETGGNSWLIPQWGGIQILNLPAGSTSNSSLLKQDLAPVMHTFADQLVSLLGLPQSPPSLPLRISSLKRERAASLILSASDTLGALSRLSLKLEAIAIPNNVAASVEKTIAHLEQACRELHDGRFQKALQHARIAEGEAEQAFFDPSMVGQVYFPDEHKVAVYVPLLGPMAVPLLMALIKEVKKLRRPNA